MSIAEDHQKQKLFYTSDTSASDITLYMAEYRKRVRVTRRDIERCAMVYLLKVCVLVLISVSALGVGALLFCYACLGVGTLITRLNGAMGGLLARQP